MTLEVSDDQRSTLDGMLSSLPRGPVDTPLPAASKLAGLFYHPNAGARVLALVISAGFDAVKGRDAHATRKLDRAMQVFTLVSDDSAGRDHLELLKGKLDGDVPGFLDSIHEQVAPYLHGRMEVKEVEAPAPTAMPRAIEDGDELPTERRSVPDKPARKPRRRPEPEPEAADEPAEAVPEVEAEEAEAADTGEVEAAADTGADEAVEAEAEAEAGDDDADESDDDGIGPSEAEAAAAAAAALAAIEAPYEDVVEDDAPPRFDPDRDLKPEDNRRRRRRSKSPEGLERPRPDQVAKSDAADDGSPEAEAPEEERALEPILVERSSDSSAVAEAGLEALKLALRRAREAGFTGRLAVEVKIAAGAEGGRERGGDDDGRRRRRRRRRRSRSD